MSTNKETIRKSVEVLIETAADAARLARTQRVTADEQSDMAVEQHATAHKLEHLSEDLTQGAADLKASIAGADKPAAAGVAAAAKPKASHRRAAH